jgi:uncharacterized protein YjbI with pentapeptide repeats
LADITHLQVLRQGAAVWNAWRNDFQTIRPDLSEIELDVEVLGRGSMDDAYDCWLDGIDFHDAVLTSAKIEHISLAGASFKNANLMQASAVGNSFKKANFAGACLVKTDFTGSDLTDADMSGAVMGDTVLARLDLSRTKGLMNVSHRFTSIVDVTTLDMTGRGILSEPLHRLERQLEIQGFFAKCGVPSPYLKFFESLTFPA